MFGSNGSQYAQTNRNRILSDAIPALSWAVGSHAVTNLDAQFGGKHNYDMKTELRSDWPSSRPSTGQEAFNWYHSDFKDVAYVYTHLLFDEFVTLGGLK